MSNIAASSNELFLQYRQGFISETELLEKLYQIPLRLYQEGLISLREIPQNVGVLIERYNTRNF